MNVFIGLIILAAFLQSSFVGLNVVLLLLVARSFLIESKTNYYVAFFAGILVGLLSAQNLGFWPIIYLSSVKMAYVLRKLPFSISILTSIPVFIISTLLAATGEYFIINQTINWMKPLFEIGVGILIFIFLNFWEDRFMVHSSNVKLKIRK